MSFKKIATIITVTAASLSFAGIAQAADTASGDFDGNVPAVCTVTSPNMPMLTLINPSTLSGEGLFKINCNSAAPKVTVAPDTSGAGYQIRNGVHTAGFTSGSAGAFSSVTSGTSGTGAGGPTINDAVKVKVNVSIASPGILLGGTYKAVTKVTVAPL